MDYEVIRMTCLPASSLPPSSWYGPSKWYLCAGYMWHQKAIMLNPGIFTCKPCHFLYTYLFSPLTLRLTPLSLLPWVCSALSHSLPLRTLFDLLFSLPVFIFHQMFTVLQRAPTVPRLLALHEKITMISSPTMPKICLYRLVINYSRCYALSYYG